MPPRHTNVGARSTAGGGGVAAAATLSGSTRARADPKRRIGNGNAVANGVDMTRVGILSDRELAFFQRLAGSLSAEQQRLDARKQEEERRRELSKARTANWPDTIEARHDRFLQAQQDAKDAAEERQKVLDELYAQQLEEERQAVIAQQELQHLKEDPRGRNARSMKLLHETLKTREEQVAYKNMRKQEEAAETADTQRQLQLQAWGDQTEAMHRKLETRQRNVEEKNANLEIVLYQIEQRRNERAEERQDRVRVDQEAAEERAEQVEEDTLRRTRERETGAFNESHRRTAFTKSQKLQERVAENAQDEAALRAEEARVDAIKKSVTDKQKQKQAAVEQRKQAGLQQYLEEASPELLPTYRTQDVFEQKGTSFLERLYNGDVQRQEKELQYRSGLQQQRRQEEEEAAAAAAAGGATSTAASTSQKGKWHKAATTAAGFMDAEEERAYAAEMRKYPEQLRAQEAAEAAARRAAALHIEEIQKLQAAEKRENARRAVEARREEARMQQEQRDQEDARYREYIDSIVPADMDPVLMRRAKQLD